MTEIKECSECGDGGYLSFFSDDAFEVLCVDNFCNNATANVHADPEDAIKEWNSKI